MSLLDKLNTPINSLRLLGALAFASTTLALLLPHGRNLFTGAAVTMTGSLAVQLFLTKSAEAKPRAADAEPTTLGLSSR